MKFFVVLILLVSSMAASAQKRIVSIDAFDLSYTGGLVFRSDNGKGSYPDNDETNLRLNLNFAQVMEQYPQLMWKGEFHWNRVTKDDPDTEASVFGVAGGVLFNLDANDIKNTVFAGGAIGLERMTIDDGMDDESGFNLIFKVEGGKRWDMGQYAQTNISYAPTIALEFRRYGGGIRDEFYTNGHEIKLNFLKFDILF